MSKARTVMMDMEPSLNDAANLASALAMAIQGFDKLAIEDEHQKLALESLADEVRFAAHKCLALWSHAHELFNAERNITSSPRAK